MDSLNFGFLKPHSKQLATLGGLAESYFPGDPSTAIVKLRQFAELMAKLIDHLDQAVLAKAFRGELVPQDPNDEPASVLLDRIQAEREAAPKARRGRKKAI